MTIVELVKAIIKPVFGDVQPIPEEGYQPGIDPFTGLPMVNPGLDDNGFLLGTHKVKSLYLMVVSFLQVLLVRLDQLQHKTCTLILRLVSIQLTQLMVQFSVSIL